MDYGAKKDEPWVQAKIEAGDPPPFIVNWPTVDSDLVYAWEAWHRMAGDRQSGFGPGGTPFAALDRYADRYDVGEFDIFHRLILAMDDCYLRHANEKRGHG